MNRPSVIRAYRIIACLTFLGAFVEPSWRRFIWAFFAVALYTASEGFKEIEKEKAKERARVTLAIGQQGVKADQEAIGEQYKFVTDHIAKAFENALNQVSFSVRDSSPTRVAYRKLPDEK